jgi:hypothetical protein
MRAFAHLYTEAASGPPPTDLVDGCQASHKRRSREEEEQRERAEKEMVIWPAAVRARWCGVDLLCEHA